MASSISATGSFVKATGTSLTTLSVTPSTVGDAFMFTASYINSATLSTVSGGGCTTWTKLVGAFGASSTAKVDLWLGVITTVGSATITIAGSGLTNTQRLCSQQFTSGGGAGTVWAIDGSGGTISNSSNATVTFPTLTPSGDNRLYMGYGLVQNSATANSQTAGYTLDLDPGSNPYMFNPSVSAVQSPTCTQTAGTSGAIAALVTATNPMLPHVRQTPLVPRLRSTNY